MNEEEFDSVTGYAGIDTLAERQKINYRPLEVEEERERRALIDDYLDEVVVDGSDPVTDTMLPTDLAENMIELDNLIQAVKERIEDAITDIKIPIVNDASASLALQELDIDQDYLDASLYKKLLDEPKTPASEYLIQVWEDHAEDIEGTLAMEYYEDILEIEKDFKTYQTFTNETIFQVLGVEFQNSDNFLKELKTKEKEYGESITNVQKEKAKLEVQERAAFIAHDLAKVVALKDESRPLRRKGTKYENERVLMNESMDISNDKLKTFYQTVRMVDRNLDREIYDSGSPFFSELFPYYESEVELKQGLSKAKGLLKLSVDKENETKQELKDVNRNHLSLEKRIRMQNTVLDHLEVTDKWASDWKEMLLEQTTSTEDQDKFFNAIAVGMHHSYEQRDKHMEDFYRMSMQDAQVRQEKVRQVFQKEIARTTYKDISNFIDQI